MGITKSHIFTLKENKLAKYAKALGHPARISILKLLAKKQACICGDIVDESISSCVPVNFEGSGKDCKGYRER